MSPVRVLPSLLDGGECGALLSRLDWANNPLGHPNGWPPELTTVVNITMGSTQPMLIVWGPQQITLYNDAYAALCGNRHPEALGKPFRDLWFDIWDQVEPIIDAAYDGISTSMDDITLIMHRKGYAEETHFAFSYTPVRNREGEVLGMFCPCTETTAEVAWKKAQEAERNGFFQVFETALGAIALLDGPDHVFRYVNADYQALIGHRDVVGQPVRLALPEVVEQGFIGLLDGVYTTGEPFVGRSIPVDLQRVPGDQIERRVVDFLYNPMRDPEGHITGIFAQVIDVTDRAEAEQRQRLVNLEVGHRMRNQLSLVQSIIHQTLRSAPDVATASRVLTDRILVLSRAQDLVVSGVTGGADVADIVRDIVAVHDNPHSSHFRIEGAPVQIASGPALMMSLVLHELCTNAVKYGALSTDAGRVTVRWWTDLAATPADMFHLSWTEDGGPPVASAGRPSTGSRLIKAGLTGDHSSKVALDFHPGGLRATVSAALSALQLQP